MIAGSAGGGLGGGFSGAVLVPSVDLNGAVLVPVLCEASSVSVEPVGKAVRTVTIVWKAVGTAVAAVGEPIRTVGVPVGTLGELVGTLVTAVGEAVVGTVGESVGTAESVGRLLGSPDSVLVPVPLSIALTKIPLKLAPVQLVCVVDNINYH